MKQLLQTRRVFVLILALGLFTMAARSATDPDMWWHLRTGQLILQNHRIFHADPYSFTRFGQPWVDHEWLSQVFICSLYRVAGWGGLIAGFAAIIAAAFLLVFRRSPGQPYIAGAITAWGAVASIPCGGVRPQMLTLLLASILLLILERSYQRPKLLWWIPPLMLLWVNLHAGFAVGIALLALFLIGDGLDLAFGLKEPHLSPERFRQLALIIATCAAIVPLNPYGLQMYRYPFATLHSRAMQAYIGEWASPDFHQGRYLPVLVLMLATLVLAALSPRRLRPRELLLLTVTTYAALRSVRHIPIYVLVAVPLVSGMIQAWMRERLEIAAERRKHKAQGASPGSAVGDDQVPEGRKSGWSLDFLLEASQNPLTLAKLAINAVLLVGFLCFTVARLHYVVVHQPETEAKEFPAAAASFLMTSRPAGPMLNHYNWGGYFIWKLSPAYKVYIDGRADLYGDAFMDEFAATYYLKGKSWQDPLSRWGIETVVLPPDAPLIAALREMPAWKQVFADRQAVILTRTGSRR
ncbi:MAG: hypothetical protein WAL32_17615 [Terriglobales bacterium]